MTKDLTRGTPWKLILQFALPIMAGISAEGRAGYAITL